MFVEGSDRLGVHKADHTLFLPGFGDPRNKRDSSFTRGRSRRTVCTKGELASSLSQECQTHTEEAQLQDGGRDELFRERQRPEKEWEIRGDN